MRFVRHLCAVLASVLIIGLVPMSVVAADSQVFPETNQTSSGAFYTYWLAHGQTAILGLPLTKTYKADTGFITQIYERAIFEWHPENPQENRVLLSRLGDKISQGLSQRTASPVPCDASCDTFSATNHTLRGPFRVFWQGNGGLANFGYPLTEEFAEKNADTGQTYTVQYFERNRFEWHPEINGGTVLLGRLGAQVYEQTKVSVDTAAAVRVPSYDDKPLATFQVAADVSTEDRDAVQAGISLDADFFAATFAADTLDPITVIMVGKDDTYPRSWAAMANGQEMVVRTFVASWKGGGSNQHIQAITHEYFHVFQYQHVNKTLKGTLPGPDWLVEGSADFVSYKAVDWRGLIPFTQLRAQAVQRIPNGNVPILQSLESSDAFNSLSSGNKAIYDIGMLAVERLIAERGIGSLRAYFELLAQQDWHDAFKTAFGVDVDTFYQQFAQYRQNGFK